MATNYEQVLSEYPFPELRHLCVERIVHDIEHIVEGMDFDELANSRHSYILGPFSCVGMIVGYKKLMRNSLSNSILCGLPTD